MEKWKRMGVDKHEQENVSLVFRCCHKLFNRLRTLLAFRHIHWSATIKFLFFKEPKPKHHVIKNLSAWHILFVFLFPLFQVWLIFVNIFPVYGLIGVFAAVLLIDLAFLEVMHILYDK